MLSRNLWGSTSIRFALNMAIGKHSEIKMAGNTTLSVAENSPEYIAFRLMRDIASAEKVVLHGTGTNSSREWILKTYMQCLCAVRSPNALEDVLDMSR